MKPILRLISDDGCKVYDGSKAPSLEKLIKHFDEVILPKIGCKKVPLTKEDFLVFEKQLLNENKTAMR